MIHNSTNQGGCGLRDVGSTKADYLWDKSWGKARPHPTSKIDWANTAAWLAEREHALPNVKQEVYLAEVNTLFTWTLFWSVNPITWHETFPSYSAPTKHTFKTSRPSWPTGQLQ